MDDCKERILSNNYFDLITDYPISSVSFNGQDLCYVELENHFNILYTIRVREISDNVFEYLNLPKLYGLMDMSEAVSEKVKKTSFDPNSLIASGILQVQRPPLSLTGSGVAICFIGTGIDYTNPVFQNEDGTTRILAIWDQTIHDGEPPKGFLYGTEYTREEINRALASPDPYSIVPTRDTHGNGSMMAGLAAGSRLDGGATYLGAAPDADIVVVKLKECKPYLREFYLIPDDVPAFAEHDIMLAVKYVDSFAIMFQRPIVICIGVGTNMGEHDGCSALSSYLNSIAVKRNRAVVVGGGSEGNVAHHYSGVLEKDVVATDNYKDVEIRVGNNNKGFMMEFWGSIPDVFTLAIRSPGGETIPHLRLGARHTKSFGFIYERTKISIQSVLVDPASGEQLIQIRFEEPTPGIWNLRVSPVGKVNNGVFHMWLPITTFLFSEVYFLNPDHYVTHVEPSMALKVISVSTYNDINGSFYIGSGRGFSRNGGIRPSISAPGVNISTIYGNKTGTSLSAAITAGGVAQFLQWAVVEKNRMLMESTEINNYFIRGASRFPGMTYPNREWGYGKLNVLGIFDALVGV